MSASDDSPQPPTTSHTEDAAKPTKLPTASTLNKKRYHEIKTSVAQTLDNDQDKVDAIMASIRTIMKFDPDVKKYTPEQGKKMMEYRRKKAAELGVTVHEAFGGREFYQKHREQRIQQSRECMRRKKQNGA